MKKMNMMRRWLGLVLIAMLLCTGAIAEPMTYSASAKGFGGDVTVTLTMDGEKIVDVKAEGAGETAGIGSRAIEELPAAILEAQGANVEAVSGATVTSNAIKTAVQMALDQLSGMKMDAAFIAGTYQAEALGYGGMLTVEVTVTEVGIEKVEVISDKETLGVGKEAIPQLTQDIVAYQSLAVDAVSGCTSTSGAVISAVDSALKAGGMDTTALYQPIEKEDLSGNPAICESADIIVVGAGPAGLAASIAAADEGASVILLEKMSFVGGSSAISGGSVNSGGSKYQAARGLEDSVEILYEDILRHGGYQNDTRLARLYAENVGQTFDWLVDDLGVIFEDEVYYAAEHTVQRSFKSQSNPLCYSTIQTLKQNALDKGVKLHLNMRANALMTDESGAIVGVKAEGENGQPYEFAGKAVVLTTGGFGANRELLTPNLASCLFYGAVSSTGDGLKMAQDVGAITQNMSMGKCVPDGFEYAPGLGKSTSNSNKVAFLNGSAILLNEQGERFALETGEREVFAQQIRNSTIGMNYLFMDQATWDIFLTKNKTFSLEDAERWFAQNGASTPVFIRGKTIEGVAKAAGLDPSKLQATIDRYNTFVASGVDEDFGRTAENMKIAIGEGPYYIIEQKLRFATTLGGLRTSTSMEVYTEGDIVIPGLYAGGEIVGGAQGENALVGGNNGWALTSGKIAGETAARAIK